MKTLTVICRYTDDGARIEELLLSSFRSYLTRTLELSGVPFARRNILEGKHEH